jgi:hypothetical protein
MEMVKAWGGLTVTCVQLALAIFGYAVVWQLHYNILGLFAPFYFFIYFVGFVAVFTPAKFE